MTFFLTRRCRWLVPAAVAGVLLNPPPGAACDSIRVLDAVDAALEVTLMDKPMVVEPGPLQEHVVRDGSRLLSPFLCQAVTRVAFVDRLADGEKGWVLGGKPDLISLSSSPSTFQEANLDRRQRPQIAANVRAEAIATLVHEAAHSAAFLLQAHDGVDDAPDLRSELSDLLFADNDWSDAAHAAARDAISRTRLMKGFVEEWQRIHDSFVKAGLSNPYHGQGQARMSAEQILRMGVTSAYGGRNADEDIAEMTAAALASSAYDAEGVNAAAEDLACRAMRSQPGPAIPDQLAAVFTKVGLLESLGLIGADDYEACVGNLAIRGSGSGFFTLEEGQQIHRYAGDVKGKLGQMGGGGAWYFQMEAKGEIGIEDQGRRPARIVLTLEIADAGTKLDDVSFPRGLYRIAPGASAFNTLQIYSQDGGEEKIAIELWEADVLVARASHTLVEGSVFIRKYINYTELFKLPQPPKKERIITFRKQN